MNEGDEDPKEWEIQDEQAPESLQWKWFEESLSSRETIDCPACQKQTPKENLNCVYCAAPVFQDSGLLGRMLYWFKGLFK